MTPPTHWPYVTASLTVHFLPEAATRQMLAVLVTNNKPAYRLTPASHAALWEAADRLEAKLRAENWIKYREAAPALEQVAATLCQLWEWMSRNSPDGSVATEPARLPDVRGLVATCRAIEGDRDAEESGKRAEDNAGKVANPTNQAERDAAGLGRVRYSPAPKKVARPRVAKVKAKSGVGLSGAGGMFG